MPIVPLGGATELSFAPGRNVLIDPATNTGYAWDINHEAELAFGKERKVERTARTGFVGLVRQQGDDGPLLMQLTGKIFKKDQYNSMWHFYKLCESQTVHFRDFNGQLYEVLFDHFTPIRVRVGKNHRDFANAPYWRWDYTLEFDVVTIISGDLLSAGLSL